MSEDAIQMASRNERRPLLKAEGIARKTGKWGSWETINLPQGPRTGSGWLREVEQVHKNKVFSILDRFLPDGTRHLAISSLSGVRPTWWEMQRIKDELAGTGATGVEVYPPHNEIVDAADMFHLWILPIRLSFALAEFAPKQVAEE